jgi:hypothetical protein
VAVLDREHAGIERPAHRLGHVHVYRHIGAPVTRRLYCGSQFLRRELGSVDQTEVRDDTATCRQLDLTRAFLELLPHGRQHCGDAVSDHERAEIFHL